MDRAPTHIVMVGTDPTTRGGISSVVNAWRTTGLFERWPVEYVTSHRPGSALAKLVVALGALAKAVWIGLRRGPGLLHVHSASRASFWRKALFMSLARAAGWPVVFHLHGGGFARFFDQSSPLAQRAIRFFLDRSDAIVVVSERWAGWMRSVTANPRVVCISNPVALPRAIPVAREPGRLVFAGRCEEAKGIYDLFAAVSALRPEFPRLRVECAGDGDLARMRRRAQAAGIGSRVTMHGWLAPAERDRLLASAAIFVLPSHVEGLPVSLLEAMAAGCPVIATSVGGIPDLVRHGENGLVVPARSPAALADALRTLLADPDFAARLGAQARATVASGHTVEQAIARLDALYASLGVRRAARRAPIAARSMQESS